MKKLIIIDNEPIYNILVDFIKTRNRSDIIIRHSGKLINKSKVKFFKSEQLIIDVKKDLEFIKENFDLIISIHCQQIFPKKLTQTVRCVNLHPGFNPSTRGWYPHVFSILHDLPVGATLHEMDEEIDHGPIIARKLVEKNIWDTSFTLYKRIIKAEVELFENNFDSLIDYSYKVIQLDQNGNLYLKSDYKKQLEIDLNQEGKFIDFYNKLRALSHDGYWNTYFYLPNSKEKVFLSLAIKKEAEKDMMLKNSTKNQNL